MLKLHFAPNSRAGRIVWLLEELELPYDINKMAFHPQDLKSDEHRARHPLGRVPVLDDADITIFESGAIVEYVIARHKNARAQTQRKFPSVSRVPAVVSLLRGNGYATNQHYCCTNRAITTRSARRESTQPSPATFNQGLRTGQRGISWQRLFDRRFFSRRHHARPRMLYG